MSSEHVLVVQERVIEGVGKFQGLTFNVEPYLDKFFAPEPEANSAFFMPRSEAEENSNFKQIIPYVLIEHADSPGCFLVYRRGKKGAESRLVGNRSIGIGGHINPIDLPQNGSMRDAYFTAEQREVREEVTISTEYRDSVVALLYDGSNKVGQVHLGVVHHWKLLPRPRKSFSVPLPYVESNEDEITELSFMSIEELQKNRDDLETWSQIILDEYLTHQKGDDFNIRPDWDEYLMTMACYASSRSLDPSTKHGAVVVDEHHRCLGIGYNSFPRGGKEDIYPRTRPEKYISIIHSEDNAISNCAVRPEGGTLYVTGLPCPHCMGKIIQAGIKRVVYGRISSIMIGGTEEHWTRLMAANHDVELVQYQGVCPQQMFDYINSYLNHKWDKGESE